VNHNEPFMIRKPRPTNRQVLSERAKKWIAGSLDSDVYFSIARRQAHEAARREVVARLQRTPWWIDVPTPNRARH
jgi:hypothetical protein